METEMKGALFGLTEKWHAPDSNAEERRLMKLHADYPVQIERRRNPKFMISVDYQEYQFRLRRLL